MKVMSVENKMKLEECRTLLVICNISKFSDKTMDRTGADLDNEPLKIAFETNYDCEVMMVENKGNKRKAFLL